MTSTYVSDKPNNFRTELGASLFRSKYAISADETWLQRCQTIVDDVCGTRGGTMHPLMAKSERDALVRFMHKFMFIPGGRYVYYAGRGVSFYNNCFIFKGTEDTREEWGRLLHSASDALMSGGGIGVDYSVFRPRGELLRRTGGVSSGPIPLAKSINEVGRNVRQGGSRRSAIYGSLNWQHGDAKDWLKVKDWKNQTIPGTDIAYTEAKVNDFDAEAPLDFTNISLNYDNSFLSEVVGSTDISYVLSTAQDHDAWAAAVDKAVLPSTFIENTRMSMYNGEPGFSFNFFDKEDETGRNACVSGSTRILTSRGYLPIEKLVGTTCDVWNGSAWSSVSPFSTGENALYRVSFSDGTHLDCTAYHKFVLAGNVRVCADELNFGDRLEKFEMPVVDFGEDFEGVDAYSQGFYSGDGNSGYGHSWVYEPKYCCADRLVGDVSDKETFGRREWKHGLMQPKNWVPLNTSLDFRLNWFAGLIDADGCVTRDKNGNGLQVTSVDPEFLNEVRLMLTTLGVRAKVAGGVPEGWRKLPDGNGGLKEYFCKETARLLVGNTDTKALVDLGLKTSRLDISDSAPQRDARRFVTVVSVVDLNKVEETFCFTEREFNLGTFEGIVTGQCCEVTSADDSDLCNLGSVNMAACSSLAEFTSAVELGSKFLICGSIRGDLPDLRTKATREKNRRIGLGLMGVHEWLLQRGHRYEMNDELRSWMKVYMVNGEKAAQEHCDRFFINHPAGYRAIAPTGTIGTMAGTTTGIEPVFAVAYKRRYIEGDNVTGVEKRKYQYYVDSAAQDLMNYYGVDPDSVESALDLAKDPERRIKFQADLQDYVDMAISSTLNLPEWGSEHNNEGKVQEFAKIIAKYAPRLRGLTAYPDGSRGGQPLVSVPLAEAQAAGIGIVYEENSEKACKSGVCGI